MLVTALVGPVFLGLSLFPVGTKPLITWGVSFLTLGFCKICFSLISGLSALAIVLELLYLIAEFAGCETIDRELGILIMEACCPTQQTSILRFMHP
jgi:hypothetical protein